MEGLIAELAKHINSGAILSIVAIILVIANSGIVQHWLGGRRSEREAERAREIETQQELIENYKTETESQRRWRDEDSQRYSAQIATLEKRLENAITANDKMTEAVVLSERGNARLRHALNQMIQIIVTHNDIALRRGEQPVISILSLRGFFGLSDDLDDKLKEILGTARENGGSC